MKKIICAWVMAVLPFFTSAQLGGTVSDSATGEKIRDAVVAIRNSYLQAVTDPEGRFSFPDVTVKPVTLEISHLGYESQSVVVSIPSENVPVRLKMKMYLSDEAVVTATRASDNSPTAFSVVRKEELLKSNLGKDLPFLIQSTPSVVVTSDAGNGVGYTGLRIRGSDATRVNVTINGIPVNDAEENGVFWVDLPDLVSSVSSIQIQRGIGTSTNGAGAFGASVNMLTSTLSASPYAAVNSSFGSFNTWKNTVRFGTGLLKNKFAFEGRLSKITSDGFADRATSDLKSFYLSGGYYGKKSSLRAVLLSGKEKTYQSWNGVPEAVLNNDRDALVTHYYNNLGYLYFTADDSVNLFSSGRTYNYFTYSNQTDNYQQDYYQLLYSIAAGDHLNLNAAVHYTKGKGYYEEFKYSQSAAAYDLIVPGDTAPAEPTDLIRQKWLNNDFYGVTLSANYKKGKLDLSAGAAAYRYEGLHYDQLIWTGQPYLSNIPFIYDENEAVKNDMNVFVKAIFSPLEKLHLFGDFQYRTVDYTFTGFGNEFTLSEQHAPLDFLNPKGGITYDLNEKSSVYISYAIGNKEPIRADYVNSTPFSRPRPERMQDTEAGYRFTGKRFSGGLNVYYMNYTDQLILTGQINDVGAYTRMNVDKSYRAGAEMSLAWVAFRNLSLSGNLTLSRNRIERFDEYLDDYDADGQQINSYEEPDIAFSPAVISSVSISWMPMKYFSVDLTSRYVGRQYLDNTSNSSRQLDAYLVNDLQLEYIVPLKSAKQLSLVLAAYNLFDREYSSNGYTYGYIYGGNRIQEEFYFPQAGRHFHVGVEVMF